MSYGFLFLKACGGDVGGHWLPFSFASGVDFSLSVSRPEVRSTSLRIEILTSVASTADLMRDENPMN